eukprot:TRINITY_DN5897_c0_g1_i1.p1 TRINITY_DN5897_c0_g1~~TRINITY_DN5897_c0_g1_i1.p1  ORF type:complete len:321 (+),score=63.50 TRINITY_DN5897_c0_g1_i1:238-1200(+)
MAALQLPGALRLPLVGASCHTEEFLRHSDASYLPKKGGMLYHRSSLRRQLTVSAVATLAPKFTKLKPLGDRMLLKIIPPEKKSPHELLLLKEAFNRPPLGEVVALSENYTTENSQRDTGIQLGDTVVYSKYAGEEVEFNEADHLILGGSDIIGLLGTDDIKDLKPLNDRILVQITEDEDQTDDGVLLLQSAKEKLPTGEVVAVGSSLLRESSRGKDVSDLSNGGNNREQSSAMSKEDINKTEGSSSSNEGNHWNESSRLNGEDSGQKDGNLSIEDKKRKKLILSPGSKILFSKYAGIQFNSKDGSPYLVIRQSDIIALLP